MNIRCPNCREDVFVSSPPTRKHENGANDAWVCLHCFMTVCVHCYHRHTQQQHANVLSPAKNTKKRKRIDSQNTDGQPDWRRERS